MAAPKSVISVQFSILTTEEIIADGIEITTPTNRSSPVTQGTPYDPRLGILEKKGKCEYCGKGYFMTADSKYPCPGHFGYIMLKEPCYNPEYMEYAASILKCICHSCAAPRIPEALLGSIATLKAGRRFKAYKKKAETLKQCSECHEALASFSCDEKCKSIKMYFDDKAKAIPVTAREAHAILRKMTSEASELIGLNGSLEEDIQLKLDESDGIGKAHLHEVRPESLITCALPVPPIATRPWVIKGSERKDDDLTDALNTILKLNARLDADSKSATKASTTGTGGKTRKAGKLTESERRKVIEDLHNEIWALHDNSKQKAKNANRKPKGLRDRLVGKVGHLQENVGGKRVDFSGRTVIVGAGALFPMNWVGIPQRMAKTFTIPERVLEWNMDYLTDLLHKGKINKVVRDGVTIDVNTVTKGGKLEFVYPELEKGGVPGLKLGDICRRQIKDGDVSTGNADIQIINRQPSLRTESMQGVKIRINPPGEEVIRFPMAKTRAYNADHSVGNR